MTSIIPFTEAKTAGHQTSEPEVKLTTSSTSNAEGGAALRAAYDEVDRSTHNSSIQLTEIFLKLAQ